MKARNPLPPVWPPCCVSCGAAAYTVTREYGPTCKRCADDLHRFRARARAFLTQARPAPGGGFHVQRVPVDTWRPGAGPASRGWESERW